MVRISMAALLLAGCIAGGDSGDDGAACQFGDRQACACPQGFASVRACEPDGRFGECDCADDAAPAEAPSRIAVSGACATTPDLDRVALSLVLLDQRGNDLDGALQWTPESISFVAPSNFGDLAEGEAAAEDGAGAMRAVSMAAESFAFAPTGGPGRAMDPRLVLLMLDHSGSLVGIDPFTGLFDFEQASDPEDRRISFFQQLIGILPAEDFLSLVSFSGDFADITPEYSTPVRNKDVILEGLNALQFEEDGTTPLTRALEDTRQRVIEPNGAMNPVVILFTDGIESGDPTDEPGAFERAVAGYADREPGPIPVIVLHLQPPVSVPAEHRGRSARLAELACRTGGEYFFLPEADRLTTDIDLLRHVAWRLAGAWRLAVTTGLAEVPPGEWFVSTRLLLEDGDLSLSAELQDEGPTGPDRRLWFVKQ